MTMHNSLMPFADPDDGQPYRMFAYLTRTGVSTPKRAYPMTPAAITEGVEVLRFLLEFNLDFEEVVSGHAVDDTNGPYGGHVFEAAWRVTQSTLKVLRTRPSLNQLTNTALAIFQQTACPLELPWSAADGALEQALSGQRLRWETIGICCTRIGCFSGMARNTGLSHGPRQSNFDRQTTMLMALDACTQCRTFCNRVEQTNDLTLWLLSSASLLATWCCGDDSSSAWCLMGDLSSAIFALGFHKGFQDGDSGPAYLVELRRRVVAMAHEQDKGLATFVGRPPRLSRRYCVVDLPLDLSDDIMMGPIEHLEAAKAKLDENGWSGDTMLHPASRHRAMYLLSMIREEVLELSFGPQIPETAQHAR